MPENPRLETAMCVCLMELGYIDKARNVLISIAQENRNYAPAYFFLSLIEENPVEKQRYFKAATSHLSMRQDEDPFMEPGTSDIMMGYSPGYPLPEPGTY